MSYEIGLDTIHLKTTERLGHTEYCDNDALVRAVTEGRRERFTELWEYDLIWATDDGPVEWEDRGRVTNMGHAEFLEGGVDKLQAKPCPFKDVEEVLEFDAVKEYGLPETDGLVEYYETSYKKSQADRPESVYTGGYYKTIVSGAIQTFGWDMLLLAAAYPEKFEKVLDSFFRLSLHYYKAQARTSIEAFICHDDMVWTAGPFMNPDFYRKAIFPRYRELWEVLKNAGKKVLYCCDGDYSMFLDDVARAGADGFIFEPLVPLEMVVEKYGTTHAVVGSKVDCRTLTFGKPEEIKKEIDATLKLAFGCPGFIFAVGNHIPSNVPVENCLFYFDYLSKRWKR